MPEGQLMEEPGDGQDGDLLCNFEQIPPQPLYSCDKDSARCCLSQEGSNFQLVCC